MSTAKGQIEDRVWSSYSHLLLWDASALKLKDIVLGWLHPGEPTFTCIWILVHTR